MAKVASTQALDLPIQDFTGCMVWVVAWVMVGVADKK
jgi:hypothetical protein